MLILDDRRRVVDANRAASWLDVVMPGMNGPALAQRLIASRPGLRVLLISGYAEVAMPFEAGGSSVGFLGKPFRASVLGNKVREVLSGCRNDRRRGMSRG